MKEKHEGTVMDPQDIGDELSRLADQNARLAAEVTRLRDERIPHVDRSSRRRDRRLTLAYVLVTAVVVGVASAGSASALDGSNTVFGDDIVNGAVTTGDLKDGTVGSVDVRDGSIGTADIANGGIKGEDLNLFNDNQCTGESVQGTANINADPGVPLNWTTNWIGYGHSCSGEPVKVSRTTTGRYGVEFGIKNPARLAVVSAMQAGTTATVYRQPETDGDYAAFRIDLRNAAGNLVDSDFTILIF